MRPAGRGDGLILFDVISIMFFWLVEPNFASQKRQLRKTAFGVEMIVLAAKEPVLF